MGGLYTVYRYLLAELWLSRVWHRALNEPFLSKIAVTIPQRIRAAATQLL
jgi:hypothetical protein